MANRNSITKAIVARSPSSASSGGTTAPKPSQAIGSGKALRTLPSGLVKPKGFSSEWNLAKASGPNPQAAPTPAATPAATSTPATLWSSKYEQSVGEANKKYLNTLNNLDLTEQSEKQEYGLDPGFNDYKANPYSRAAALEQSFETANRGTTNAAGLQLYSGSTSNKLGANRTTRDGNFNNLQSEYQNALNTVSQSRAKAKEEQAETDQEAYWNSVREAEEHEPVAEAARNGTQAVVAEAVTPMALARRSRRRTTHERRQRRTLSRTTVRPSNAKPQHSQAERQS